MNCPEGHFSCSLCSYLIRDTCTQTGEAISIFDLMTHSELIQSFPKPGPTPTSDEIHRLTVLINDLENRLNVHIDNSKVMAKKRGKKEQF